MKTKIIFFLIIVVLFTFFVTQNTQIVSIYFFYWKFESPAILLIIITGFIGIVLGLILGSILKPVNKDKKGKIIQSPGNKDIVAT
jgi:uncharacterized integral membrane protein